MEAAKNAKILVCDKIAPEGVEKLKEAGEVEVSTGLTGGDLIQAASDVSAIVVRSATKISAEVIQAADNLKIIGRAGVGVDNIDVKAASERGVVVVNSPEGNTRAAAEHAVALLLSLTRNVPEGDARMRRQEWKRNDLLGNEVRGKTIGLVGLGKVGSQVALMARGLGMKVITYDVALSDERCRQLHAEPVSFEELLAESDYISIHVPLTDGTRGLIGEEQIAKLKPGCRIVNSSRGGIIDEAALARALSEEKIAGAAMDVYEGEPEPWDSPLMDVPRTVLTPHLGASTTEAQIGAAMDVAEQIVDVLGGLPPRSAVNLPFVEPETLRRLKPWLQLAERMGQMGSHLARRGLRTVRLTYSGAIASHDCTLATRYFLAGMLRRVMSTQVNEVNATLFAAERGVDVAEIKHSEHPIYHSHMKAEIVCDESTAELEGAIRGRAEPRIVRINQFRVDVRPEGTLLMVISHDQPGVIGKVGQLLGEHGVNIAQMHVGGTPAEEIQMMVLNLDSSLPEAARSALDDLDLLQAVHVVDLPPAAPIETE